MAGNPYYQAQNQKTNLRTTPGMVRGAGKTQTVRPAAEQKPDAESSARSGISFQPIQESPIYSSEIGREAIQIQLDGEDILKGFIYSEILAPPKSRRTGR